MILFKVAKKKDRKIFDPYAAATIGLGMGAMYAGHKAGLAQDVKEVEDESKSMRNTIKLIREGKIKKSDLEQAAKVTKHIFNDEETKELKRLFDAAYSVAKKGSPVEVRNKYAAIATGLGLGALGVGLYGSYQHRKSKDKYSPISVVPEYAFSVGAAVPSVLSLIRTIKDKFGKHSARYASLAAVPAMIGAGFLLGEKEKKIN